MIRELILNHLIAYVLGFVLDLIIGDPYWMPHPIRLIGRLIGLIDRRMMDSQLVLEPRHEREERKRGLYLVIIVLFASVVAMTTILVTTYYVNRYAGIICEAIFTCYIFAAKSLRTESMKVYKALKLDDIEGARLAVSMIVGRDTDVLDKEGITKAAVETVAENTSDGVIAPMLYTFIGGPVLGMLYKAVNTMDSMVGYHNERYENFGRCAARLDDYVNLIPARLSAFLIIIVAGTAGSTYSAKDAYRIFKRDRFKHKSPNSAQTESACAGALGIQLAGDASYFGKIVKKPFIGDRTRAVEAEDIPRTNRLMYGAAFILFFINVMLMVGIIWLT